MVGMTDTEYETAEDHGQALVAGVFGPRGSHGRLVAPPLSRRRPANTAARMGGRQAGVTLGEERTEMPSKRCKSAATSGFRGFAYFATRTNTVM